MRDQYGSWKGFISKVVMEDVAQRPEVMWALATGK